MQIIENKLIKEKVYVEKLESGLTIMCIPKNNTRKKYAIFSVGYGSNDNEFIIKDTNEKIKVPDGVAHFLEHKLFEQEDGTNSLNTLSALGIDANAYTTNDHTAFLFECTNNYEQALDELLKYVQNPYFTDENVEKEKGIIAQEINMYDDEPEWKVYINCMKAMYKKNPIRIDVAGSVESIQKIDKDILYTCYNNFYVPENMVLVMTGNFNPEEMIEKVKSKITIKNRKHIEKVEYVEDENVNQKKISEAMDVSLPIFAFGYKIKPTNKDKVKRNLSIEILLEILFGTSSELYKELYEKGLIYDLLSASYESAKDYAHAIIQGKTLDVENVKQIIEEKIEKYKNDGIQNKEFERAKRKIYGLYVREFNEVSATSIMFVTNYFKNINPFEYIESYKTISKDYLEELLKEIFVTEKMVESCITPKETGE